MEVGHRAEVPTYAGGLGVLAGDTLRSAADLRLPIVAVTLLHRKGYFRQILDRHGGQQEAPVKWPLEDFVKETPARTSVVLEGRTVHVRAWTFPLRATTDHTIPVYLLDTNLDENNEWDRSLTDSLYGGDAHYRLCQEIVLGIAGVRVLRQLGYRAIERFHMNEGHAALLGVELLQERLREVQGDAVPAEAVEAVKKLCVFTTHTPVPAGHDVFPADQARRILDPRAVTILERIGCLDGSLNMTHLAMRLSHAVNAVSQRHAEVSRTLLGMDGVEGITNGVHAPTWVAPKLAELYDRYLPRWRTDAFILREALRIPKHELWSAHTHAKLHLLDYVNRTTGVVMDRDVFTIGFARRAAAYKRAALLFDNIDRIRRLHKSIGPIQIVYAGKAHPSDQGAKEIIRSVHHAMETLRGDIAVCYLADYDMTTCALMTAGVDVWLNTPKPPLEASGTSGMKAAMNGVPSLSVLDGWWVEGCIENVTGWGLGAEDGDGDISTGRAQTAAALYDKLEYIILPMFYRERDRYVEVMRHAIAINGPHFSTRRMVLQYATRMYYS